MKVVYSQKTANEIIQLVLTGKLNPDPIGQRPPTSQGYSKSQDIIWSMLSGVGIGMVALRDISEDAEMQKVYPGVHYLVIDGGHRVRALVKFYNDKFAVQKKKFKDWDIDLNDFQVALDITTCTSKEAVEKFRNLNQTTPVNFMEMLMCDDQSEVCRHVRSFTRSYVEYDNKVHDLFETAFDKTGTEKAKWFDMAPNHRRKWDEYAFIAILKSIGGGNVDAGQSHIEDLVRQEYDGNNPVTKKVLATVDRFFTDVLSIQSKRYKKLNTDIFAALQLTWFELYNLNREFKIADYDEFHESFMEAYSLLTGTADTTYNRETIQYDGETHFLKEFMRKNITNFANGSVQKVCAKRILEEMGKPEKYGVVFRDSKRSLTTSEREQKLAIQGFKCAIDGLPLKLEDSVWGHDTAWAQGGELMEGAVIRKSHNINMGQTTIEEYRMILELRKGKV
jgi:hypothetical protein